MCDSKTWTCMAVYKNNVDKYDHCISQHCQTTYVRTAPLHHACPHTHQWKTSTPSTNQSMTIALSGSPKAMVITSSLFYTSVVSKGCIPKTESIKHTHTYTQTQTHTHTHTDNGSAHLLNHLDQHSKDASLYGTVA